MATWALVNHAVSGHGNGSGGAGAGIFRAPDIGLLSTTGADLYLVAAGYYLGVDPVAGDMADVQGGAGYTLLTPQAAVGDANMKVAWFYKVAPTVGGAEAWFLTGNSRATFAGICALAISGCAASPTVTHTESGATSSTPSAGSLGAAGNLVVTAVADYTATVSSIGSSFAITDQSDYTVGNNIGIAAAWQNLVGGVAGAVNPTWTLSGAPTASAVQAIAFTPAGAGPTAPTYPQLERGIRGLARGVAGGIARSFVRKDRIFVPAYATYDLKAAA